LSLHGVATPSLLNHGEIGLVRIEGYARAPAKPHESGVYDDGGDRDPSRAKGSRIPCSDGGIRRGMRGVL
jgi:hypothetical protein